MFIWLYVPSDLICKNYHQHYLKHVSSSRSPLYPRACVWAALSDCPGSRTCARPCTRTWSGQPWSTWSTWSNQPWSRYVKWRTLKYVKYVKWPTLGGGMRKKVKDLLKIVYCWWRVTKQQCCWLWKSKIISNQSAKISSSMKYLYFYLPASTFGICSSGHLRARSSCRIVQLSSAKEEKSKTSGSIGAWKCYFRVTWLNDRPTNRRTDLGSYTSNKHFRSHLKKTENSFFWHDNFPVILVEGAKAAASLVQGLFLSPRHSLFFLTKIKRILNVKKNLKIK